MDKYDVMKEELSDYLTDFSAREKILELDFFDMMVDVRQDYQNRVSANEELVDLVSEISHMRIEDEESVYDNSREYLETILDRFETAKSDVSHGPAYIIALNFDEKNKRHKKHIFNGDWHVDRPHYDEMTKHLEMLAYKDNATLIDKEGKLLAERVYLHNLNPPLVVKNNGHNLDSSLGITRALGFHDLDVSARHKSALAFSYHVRRKSEEEVPVVVYTMSEETGTIRRMEEGKITHSTFPGEGIYSKGQSQPPE